MTTIKVSVTKARRHLSYCLAELLTATGQRHADLLAKAEHLRTQLAGRCRECGRTLTDADSVARGIGPECRKAAA